MDDTSQTSSVSSRSNPEEEIIQTAAVSAPAVESPEKKIPGSDIVKLPPAGRSSPRDGIAVVEEAAPSKEPATVPSPSPRYNQTAVPMRGVGLSPNKIFLLSPATFVLVTSIAF